LVFSIQQILKQRFGLDFSRFQNQKPEDEEGFGDFIFEQKVKNLFYGVKAKKNFIDLMGVNVIDLLG